MVHGAQHRAADIPEEKRPAARRRAGPAAARRFLPATENGCDKRETSGPAPARCSWDAGLAASVQFSDNRAEHTIDRHARASVVYSRLAAVFGLLLMQRMFAFC